MCGIAGALWTTAEAALPPEALARMVHALEHRGPDDHGFWRSEVRPRAGFADVPGVALGHRRLSIIDRAGSRQPLSNEDGTVWVVFNGEIYNYPELRHRLEGSGHQLRTQGDTETLVHLYEDEGPAFLRHLWGMFALAIWDGRKGELLLARDRLGKKPLVYRLEAGRLLFASEIKSILAAPGVPREIDPQAVDEYLTYQYVPHPRTIFQGIRKLPPAHYALWREGRLDVECYWSPDFTREVPRPAEEYRRELRSLLSDAVRRRLMSEVPLGAFLSGGIDSSIIAGLMQEASSTPVKTFSIGFPEAAYDETRFAREVAAKLGTEHHELRVEPQAMEILPRLAWHFDEPFADSSALPTWCVSQLTRQHVTVALSGDGGDELFAGYDRYRAIRLAAQVDRLPRGLRAMLGSRLWQRLPAGGPQRSWLRRLRRLTEALNLPPAARYLQWIAIFGETARAGLYTDEFIARLPPVDPVQFLEQALARSKGRDAVTAVSLADLVTYLPCDLMHKVDMMSMAHGLEVRAPFLDHRVVELAAGMPIDLKLRRGQGKRILRETFAEFLPESVKKRPKMGFGVPLAEWWRGELNGYLREVLLDPSTERRGYFRPEAVRRLVEEHENRTFDHAYRLWALLMFELWHREWGDGR